MLFNSIDNTLCDIKFYVAESIHETLLDEEVILLNGDTGEYIGLQNSARVIWGIIRKHKTITLNQLISYLSEEWIIDSESKNYIDTTLGQLFNYKMILNAEK